MYRDVPARTGSRRLANIRTPVGLHRLILRTLVTQRVYRPVPTSKIWSTGKLPWEDTAMINQFMDAVLDGLVENLPTALIMASLAAGAALVARRRARKRADARDADGADG